MELVETLQRIAQNYGPGAAVAAAVAFVVFRVYFSKFFGKKDDHLATREDIDTLLHQLELAHRELADIKAQVARINWLTQQHWLDGRRVQRTHAPPHDDAATAQASASTGPLKGGHNS